MNQQIYSFDSGTNLSLYKIFSTMMVSRDNVSDEGLLVRKLEVYNECKSEFDSKFPINIFFNEYYLIYQIYKESKVRQFNLDQLESLIDANSADILTSPYMDVNEVSLLNNGTVLSDEEKITAFTQDIKDKVLRMSNNYVSKEEFVSSCNQYISAYKNALMAQTANTMAMIMQSTGFDEKLKRGGKKHWQGVEDAQKYYARQMMQLKALDEENKVQVSVMDADWATTENKKDTDPNSAKEQVVLDFGISRIDSVALGMRRTNVVEMLGPTKGGKTTFTAYLVERALSKGLNVAIWPLEGTKDEWLAIVLALMIRHSNDGNGPRINRGNILHSSYKSDAERKAVASARSILASPGYGKLSFIEGSAYIEDYIDVMINHYDTKNKYDIIVLDSPLLVLSRYGKGKVERIGECYTTFKDFVAHKIPGGILGLVTAQMKQEVINELRNNPTETIDVTAGGESAETIRTPDEVIGLFSSKTERSNGQMKLYNVASRHHETFEDFYCGCDLAIGDFFDNEELNE